MQTHRGGGRTDRQICLKDVLAQGEILISSWEPRWDSSNFRSNFKCIENLKQRKISTDDKF